MQCKYKECLGNICDKTTNFLNIITPCVNLLVRFYVGYVVLLLALIKIQDLDATMFLFENEYQVPLLPTSLAAWLVITLQIICPIMLILGYRARIAGLILFVMTVLSNYFYQQIIDNYYWMMIFAMFMSYGSDRWSLDCFLCCKDKKEEGKKK